MDTPDTAARSLARVVAGQLSAAGISQRTAAERTGIPLTTLSRRLTGTSPLLFTELVALADLLGMSPSQLARAAEAGEAGAA